jgi:tRNA(fMet)-specific endonuclease VapC
MGVILDSCVLIAGERRRETVRQLIRRFRDTYGDVECALSVISVVELTHGIYRAKTEADRERRRDFTEEFCRDMVVHSVSVAIGRLAGRIEGEQAAQRYLDSV